MASLESNQSENDAALDALCNWDFTVTGQDQALGRELATHVVAQGIADRSMRSEAPDGSMWMANAPLYRAWKKSHYGFDQPNVRTGQMLSLESLVGDTTVGPELVEMRYGTGRPPVAAATLGAEMTQGDKDITDIEKAFFCSAERPFYGLDDEISEEARIHAQAALDKFAEGIWK